MLARNANDGPVYSVGWPDWTNLVQSGQPTVQKNHINDGPASLPLFSTLRPAHRCHWRPSLVQSGWTTGANDGPNSLAPFSTLSGRPISAIDGPESLAQSSRQAGPPVPMMAQTAWPRLVHCQAGPSVPLTAQKAWPSLVVRLDHRCQWWPKKPGPV